MFKAQGNSLKAYQAGREAYKQGKKMKDNPNLYGPIQIYASWWDKGWKDEDKSNLQKKPQNV